MTVPHVGLLPAGPRDAISDVAGVTVGHCTLAEGPVQTGVTVIRLHPGDPFREKCLAAATVLNGFGKSLGLIQLQELGTIETPIALTNTLAVGTVFNAQVREALQGTPEMGREWPVVNPLVLECNDGYLNDIRAPSVGEEHYRRALAAASADFARGAVGAGRGMSCFELKGGIGSASRQVKVAGEGFLVGALVLANFGRLPDLIVAGRHLGPALVRRRAEGAPEAPETGSIIAVLATDAPLDRHQLRRLSLRAGAGLARTGSVFGHGSGDISLAISTAERPSYPPPPSGPLRRQLLDELLDPFFRAAADAVEQAILDALFAAESVTGRDRHRRQALLELAPDWAKLADGR
jgi:D-aminopeptidase